MNIREFQKFIWLYYQKNKRDLPWRKDINPYRILVSEIMLQQTQVGRVAPKYVAFLKLFPNFCALAKASPADVLRAWSGLGYNRRALYLQRAAEIVVSEHKGILPADEKILVRLPGVGINTAGAILAYAYNMPSVFIETNIRRVFIHHFFKNKTNVPDAELLPLIAACAQPCNNHLATLNYGRGLVLPTVREWYWALMDYGSYLTSTIENPNRNSKHYSKQSKFQGSLRQVRGKILKYLLEHKKISIGSLKKVLPDERVGIAIGQLVREGFIETEKNFIKLKK